MYNIYNGRIIEEITSCMIDPSVLSWSVVLFILMTGMLNTIAQNIDDD